MYEIQKELIKTSTQDEIGMRNTVYGQYDSVNLWLKRKAANTKTGTLRPVEYNKFIRMLDQYINYLEKPMTPDELIENAKQDPDSEIISLKKFHNYLVESEYSKNTATYYIKQIHTFFTFNRTLIEVILRIPQPPKKASEIKNWGFTKEEIQSLLTVANIRDKAITLCMVSSGVSEGDLFNLKFKEIKPFLLIKNNQFIINSEELPAIVHIERKKTNVSYHTCFSREAMETLIIYINNKETVNDNDYIFTKEIRSRAGKNGSSEQILTGPFGRTFSKACKKAGLIDEIGTGHQTGKTAHRLRAYFNTTLKRNGANEEFVEYMMGHNTGVKGFYLSDSWNVITEFYKKFESVLTIQNTQTDKSIETVKDALDIIATKLGVDTPEAIAKRSLDKPMNNAESITMLSELIGDAIQTRIDKKQT